jgi:hypothetical protein
MDNKKSAARHRDETWTWIITGVWVLISSVCIFIWSYPYDSNGLLTIGDLGDIGSLVAAIVAPVAVLWIIRGFYVQKAELAAAVDAARIQAEALSRQIGLAEKSYRMSQQPIFFITHRMDSKSELADYKEETHALTVSNSGSGTAYEIYLYISGKKKAGQSYWLDNTHIARLLRTDDSFTFYHDQRMHPQAQTEMLLVEVWYRNSGKDSFVDYFQVNSSQYGREGNGQQIDREKYLALMREARMAVPSHVNPRSYSQATRAEG